MIMSGISFDVSLASKIKRSLVRNKLPDASVLDWLASGENIARVRQVQLRLSEISVIKHTIDLGAPPKLPRDDWGVVQHNGDEVVTLELRADGNLYLNERMIVLAQSVKADNRVTADELIAELETRGELLNANVAEYLLVHPELWPKHWKASDSGDWFKFIFFAGSIFRRATNEWFVAYKEHVVCGIRWNREEPTNERWFLKDGKKLDKYMYFAILVK